MLVLLFLLISRLINRSGLRISHSKVFSYGGINVLPVPTDLLLDPISQMLLYNLYLIKRILPPPGKGVYRKNIQGGQNMREVESSPWTGPPIGLEGGTSHFPHPVYVLVNGLFLIHSLKIERRFYKITSKKNVRNRKRHTVNDDYCKV